jgi:uncharacterized cupin superfamily protein
VAKVVNLARVEVEGEWERPGFAGRVTRVGDRLGSSQIGGSVYELGDGETAWPYHYHHGVEEWLIVVEGAPTVRTPEGERSLRAGDVVCFPPGPVGAHSMRGPGRVLVLSANRSPSIAVYPDSDKLGTRPADDADRLDFRRGDAVDYWEGEG